MAEEIAEAVLVCGIDEVPPGEMRKFRPAGFEEIAVYHVEGKFFATSNVCTHGQASLAEDGILDGFTIECGWHFGSFDIRSGEATASPCSIPLATYPLQARDGILYITRSCRV